MCGIELDCFAKRFDGSFIGILLLPGDSKVVIRRRGIEVVTQVSIE
jgi:hypothetical protein